jgi:hypothetical protein
MFSRTTLYNTTERRVLLATNIAAAVGAVIVTIQFINPPITKFNFLHLPQMLAELLPIYFFAHLIWLFGIAFFGGPIWALMHSFGIRHWAQAGLAGGLVLSLSCMCLMTRFFTGYSNSITKSHNTMGVLTWENHRLTADGWSEALSYSLWIGQLGVVLALIIWRVAYRRTDLEL